ncbi:uncharacterized protein LAESUDRAFT_701199 [Laetiporus sulphureus 93-53]|uniref:Uncharacterized protein n=1 Tax=Laetiporus sulphureus 93-53 TaxID=1314785 RepID=A0A165DY06_9APHY|nr:uncharacterized protein LAESUDRAFT_701199 [Laetiporus sulphureus 93-53]KZT05851.1 hypothetical protein LAESUDRAFT_701199 [Laetiporus sulphureus 93-53]
MRPTLDRPVTAALATPHDAILAELVGPPQTLSTQSEEEEATSPTLQAKSAQSVDAPPAHTDQTASPFASNARSDTSSPVPAPNTVYDPFSGVPIGATADTRSDQENEFQAKSAKFDHRKDELWSHLARIRELQSEIAGMHLQMEGIGSVESRGSKRTTAGAGRMATGTIRAPEEWEDTAGAEEQQKTTRDADFATLAETFQGRRDAIDGIMGKLDDLSKALTTFHALPTPSMEFLKSRTGNKDRQGTPLSTLGPSKDETDISRPAQPQIPVPESPTTTDSSSPIMTP